MVEPELVYLDTSALIRWASGLAGSPEPRDQKGQATVNELIVGSPQLFASPITIAEFSSVTHALYRSQKDWLRRFDDVALDDVTRAFMQLISNGDVTIRDLGSRAFEMGMAYVASASREHGKKMHAWDAIHLYEACRLSRDLNDAHVEIATSDGDFDGFLAVFPEFSRYVSVLDTTVESRTEAGPAEAQEISN